MSNASPTIRVIITLCFMALLTVASIIPGSAEPGDSVFVWLVAKTPTLLQKSLHVCLYATLAVLWTWTLDAIQYKSRRLVIAVTIAVCFGAAMEWFQTKVPGRYGTVVDVILNAAGALLGLVAAIFFV